MINNIKCRNLVKNGISAVFSALIIISLFTSCATTSVIPGKDKAIKNNISIEYYNIGLSYEELKNYNKAIEYYKKASSNKTLVFECEYKIAYCNVMLKNYDDAIKGYEKLLKRDSENTSLKMSLAYVYAANGNLPKAEKIYSELYQENNTDVSIVKNYLNILIAKENLEVATQVFEYYKTTFKDDSDISKFAEKMESFNKTDSEDNDEE